MSAPKIPGHTCPLIDRIQAAIEQALKIADTFDAESVDEYKEALRDIRHELNGESDALEAVRSANLALRTAAEYWQEKAEELER